MKGFIARALTAAALGTSVATVGGCTLYRNLVDPCYPERYGFEARQSVDSSFAAQAGNGRALEQTVWNWHFEKGTDKLTIAGQDHLAQLARRRPHPDPRIYLQTSYDLAFDPATPDKFVNAQSELNNKRVQTVQRYLGAVTAARPVSFDVQIHDPGEVGFHAAPVNAYMQQLHKNIGDFKNSLPPFSGPGGSFGSGGSGGTGGSQ